MDNSDKPIGIFDSGLGGLTAVKAIREIMPNENIIYLADSAKLPYGDKTKEQIKQYVCADVGFLARHDIKALLIACNTADSLARDEVTQRYSFPVAGVVAPAAEKAIKATKNGRIGVIATRATVLSGIYEKILHKASPECKVFCVASPLLVPFAEAGKAHRGCPEFEKALGFYLSPLLNDGIDTLILGCTHYPLFFSEVAALVPRVNIICSGPASSEKLKNSLGRLNLLNKGGKPGDISCFVTGDVRQFEKYGGMFLNDSLENKVHKTVL